MLAQMKEMSRLLGEQYTMFEAMNRQVWEGQIFLATLAHWLGGLGLGLLLYPALARQSRTIAWALVAISLAMHIYAYMTPAPRLRPAERPERLVA